MNGGVYGIWQVISMAKTRKMFRFVLNIKADNGVGKMC